ncbi:monooxygenase [Coccidioides posadasii str. Silveira]|uniref:Monooxygenase n=2 Tax=Coccidioides posadasii TaxID=199306 RepID=E9D9S5_COCPS|nr:monooxygenase [Coccidioides posadasii str. Silveira]
MPVDSGIAEASASPSEESLANGTKPHPVVETANVSSNGFSASKIQNIHQKYAEERSKRLRPDGMAQYINLTTTENQSLKRLLEDKWDDGSAPSLTLEEGAHYKIIIVGAGYGGILFAVRLLDAGFKPKDIVIVDTAAGFGGTWYWNRYPGLMCDVESYIYMPLLEETGYMPKHKYSYGEELREQANRIAKNWSFADRAMFRTMFQRCCWNEDTRTWAVEMTQQQPPNSQPVSAKVHADFVALIPGLLNRPKISNFAGLETFQGQGFHAARWDYKITGGSQEDPTLTNLQDKRVGIIGTGATAIQAVPQLAKWSKHLYVFQRTPSSVDVRNQRATDPEEWAQKIATGPGWQMARNRNFISMASNAKPRPSVDMVSDGWSAFPGFCALTGGPNAVTMENVADHVAEMHSLDLPRSERIRTRVDEVVQDKKVAENLKPWYAGWCKRPGFHDEYLQAFNLPQVTLVDTGGKGVQEITKTGVVANGEHFDLDVLIFAMGFDISGRQSPAFRSGAQILGRGGQCLDEKWSRGIATLHGITTNGFPNFFFVGPSQTGVSPNYTPTLDTLARHVAFIISENLKNAGDRGKVAIEPTRAAEEAWAARIKAGAAVLAPVAGCTPSYYNGEGGKDKLSAEEKLAGAAAGPWPLGLNSYMDLLQEWRDTGDFSGFDISVA